MITVDNTLLSTNVLFIYIYIYSVYNIDSSQCIIYASSIQNHQKC